MAGKSKAFIAGGFVVGLGLIAYLAFVRPPSNGDVSGTIGAAKKYRSETMTPADVVLGDQETQQILQSAEFHRIMADPDARKVLGSHAFAEAMAAPEVQKILTEQGFQQAISSPIVAALLQNSDFRKVAGDEAMANLLASPKIAQLYAGPELASSPRPNQPEMKPMDLQNKATSEYTTKPFYMKPMDLVKAAPEAELFLKNENFSRLVASPDFAAAMKAGFGEKIFSPEFRVAVDQPALHAIVTPEFASAFANKQVADFLATPGIVSFVQSPQFAAALNAAPSADLSGKVAGD